MSLSQSSAVFFDRTSINQKKRKPKPAVYHIFHCCKYKFTDAGDVGAWCCLIVQQPQDSFSNGSSANEQTTYTISAIDTEKSHVRIRLNSLLESLKWISVTDAKPVETVFISTDVFIVSILREWIPKWRRSNFKMNRSSDTEHPNADLLIQISDIIKNMKITVKWQNEKSNEMAALSKKINDLID